MTNILFNQSINNYTFLEEINNIKSIRKVPIKFKLEDSTSKYRKVILKEKILTKKDI